MRNSTRHLIFWIVVYILWTYMKSSSTHYTTYMVVNILNVAIYMAAYYGLKHIQLPRYFDRGKMIKFALSLLFSAVIFYTIWRVAGELWLDEFRGVRYRRFMSPVDFLTQTVQFYSPAMLLLAWDFYQERQVEKERLRTLEKEKITTELKFLKAQLNPHFLFNTLNNLYSYVVSGSPKAADMVMRLSGTLDYVLYKSQQKSVPLNEEILAIENFIALEKIRYGDRLQVNFKKEGNLSVPVSPLLLLSIVENAFKHGASGDIDSPKIKIEIKESNNFIECKVWNTKSKYQGERNDDYKEGIGLSNIKRQLNLLYQDQHQLKIDEKPDSFNVELLLKSLL